MTFISHAQNYEDVMLWRALKHIKNGFYIDIGAYSPDSDSVTKAFYDAGWQGINIEPNPVFINQYKNERKRDINLSVAISDEAGDEEMFFVSNPGLSSLSQEIAEGHTALGWEVESDTVKVRTLLDVCNEYCLKKEIHFLKIDIEGLEEKALKGNNWKKFRPWVVVVEATLPMSQVENYKDWEKILLNEHYFFAYADGLNRFYIAKEHDELLPAFKYPPNIFDGFITAKEMHAEQSRAEQAEALHQQQSANQSLQEEVNTTRVRTEQFIDSLAIATNNLVHIEGQLEAKNKDLSAQQVASQSLQEELREITQKLNEQGNTLDEANSKIDELHQSNHHWWLEADRLTKELHTVHKSKSWRITWPLRKLMQLLKMFFRLPVQFFLWLIYLPKRIARWIVVKAMAYTLNHPQLKLRAIAKLKSWPKLEAKLRRLALARGLFAAQAASTITLSHSGSEPEDVVNEDTTLTPDLSTLTSSARRIYGELKTAMKQQEQKRR